ncbi:MFS transporter (plasmid) [Paraburkholderia strydomiana]
MATQWHLQRAELGPLFSAALFGLMLGFLVVSPLSPRVGHKRLMLISWTMFSIFTFATALSTSVTEVIAFRFLSGIGLGGAIPSAIALTSEYSPKRLRATSVMLIYCCYSLGFVASGFVAGSLLSRYHWGSIFMVGGATPLILTYVLWKYLPESVYFQLRKGRNDKVEEILKEHYPDVTYLAGGRFLNSPTDSARIGVTGLLGQRERLGTAFLWVLVFLNLAVFYFIQSWLPTMLHSLKYSTDSIVWVTTLTTIGGFCAAFLIGPLMDRTGPYATLAMLYLGGAASMFWMASAFSSTPNALMIAAFAVGFCVSGGQKGTIALAIHFYPTSLRATGTGWALGIGRLGGISGPLLAGLLYTAQMTIDEIFRIASLPILLGAAVTLVMRWTYSDKRRENAAAT